MHQPEMSSRETNIFMDYNATTPLAPEVVECMQDALVNCWSNPSSSYARGIGAAEKIKEARKYLAALVGTPHHEDIIFTSGGTESNNMVINGIVKYFKEWNQKQSKPLSGIPHVITTNVEHDAVILPLKHLQEEGLIDVSVIPVTNKGVVEADDILSAVRPTTSLITVMMANNETGVIMPISEIGRKLQGVNRKRLASGLIKILYHTDAAQAIGKIPVDVEELLVDYLTVVGHKFYGPRGGCLYVRGPFTATPVYPMFYGGGQENGIRPGTENTLIAIGMGKAAFLAKQYFNQNQSLFICFRKYLEEMLKMTFGESAVIHFRDPDVPFLPNTCSVAFLTRDKGITASAILSSCKQLEASVGAACHKDGSLSKILLNSGISSDLARCTIRLSIGMLTTKNEIDLAIKDLVNSIQKLEKTLKVVQS
ncbi:selenocysteine lyase-like [Neocloeon triangulifer]|uniref:selenocysteine lyase-like n=1 Tax=Neocloeon triangulifer TaxID=2078957 RepID=UPI00286ED5D1|nr:selenocysteine lyase-like [Neocloeon triangulifer]